MDPTLPDPEVAKEHERAALYAKVPESQRQVFEQAGLGEQVKDLLWMSQNPPTPQAGEAPSKLPFFEAVGQLYQNTAEAEMDASQKRQTAEAIGGFVERVEVKGMGSLKDVVESAVKEQTGTPIEQTSQPEQQDESVRPSPEEIVEARDRNIEEMPEGFKPSQEQTAFIDRLKELQNKGDVAAINQEFRNKGISPEEAEIMVGMMPALTEEQKAEALRGLRESTEEERAAKSMSEQEQTEVDAQIAQAKTQMENATDDVENSNMPEKQKRDFRAQMRALNLRLEEMKVKKIARGVGKTAVVSAILMLMFVVWEMQLIGRFSRKK